jgi:hypothetical protein
MYFELQMSGAVFTRVVRNRLRSIPLGVDLTLPDPEGGMLVVDQVVIGDTTTLRSSVSKPLTTAAAFRK